MKLFLAFFILALIPFKQYSQVSIGWNENYSINGKDYLLIDAKLDQNDNIFILANEVDLTSLDYNPILLKYDLNGNQSFIWSIKDSTNSEAAIKLALDDSANIYILCSQENIFPIPNSSRIVRINGDSGLEEFNLSISGTLGQSTMEVYDNKLYVALGPPLAELRNYDLQGNIIWDASIDSMFSMMKLHFKQNDIYIIGGDTNSLNNDELVIQQFQDSTLTGYITKSFSSKYESYQDSEIDLQGTLWISGVLAGITNDVFLMALQNSSILWDTIITGVPNAITPRLEVLSNNLYISLLNNSSIFDIYKVNSNYLVTSFGSVDSARVSQFPLGGDLIKTQSEELVLLNTRRGYLGPLVDYEINVFDSNAVNKVNFSYSNSLYSYDHPFKCFSSANQLFIIGEKTDSSSASSSINIIKLDLINPLDLDASESYAISVWPNPNLDRNIQLGQYIEDACVLIYNNLGNKVYSQLNYSGDQMFLPYFSPGLYIIHIFSNQGILRSKIIFK